MNFAWPIQPAPKSTAGQLFGARGNHTGLDMGTAKDVVLAPAAGTVTAASSVSDSRGRLVHIDHGTDDEGVKWETRYYHLAAANVKRGDPVDAGTPIAVAGAVGLKQYHPHLHFEVRRNGVAIDPYDVLPSGAEMRAAVKKGNVIVTAALLGGLAYLVLR